MRFHSAQKKIARSRELIEELSELIVKKPPYSYFQETDINSKIKSTFAKPNKNALDNVVVRCGEILHNLRSALDQAYFEVLSPHVEEKKHRSIQFPIGVEITKFETEIKDMLKDKVSGKFYSAIESIKPYAGEGGNTLLNLIHRMNIMDKHRFPTPVADITKITGERLRTLCPDFYLNVGNLEGSNNFRDIGWCGELFDADSIGDVLASNNNIFHKKLDVPVGILFSFPELKPHKPVIDTLNNMTDEVERILNIMSDSISSPSARAME